MAVQVERLLEQKAAAVAAENYDEAKRLKESIDRRPRPPHPPSPCTACLAEQALSDDVCYFIGV